MLAVLSPSGEYDYYVGALLFQVTFAWYNELSKRDITMENVRDGGKFTLYTLFVIILL